MAALDASWLIEDDPIRILLYADALAEVDRPEAAERLREIVGNVQRPLAVRRVALDALAARVDPQAVDLALSLLAAGTKEPELAAAGISALRTLHDARAVEPLILFLQNIDLGRLREDAHAALLSLTGQTHGPYYEPWWAWWQDAKASFKPPPRPEGRPRAPEQQEGASFYGIHTFSTSMVLVLDVSGSMEQAADGRTGERRIEVARKQISGSVHGLDDGSRFNLILFSHHVKTWKPGKMVEASESSRRQAVEWAQAMQPEGGTNIHDALEAAYALARSQGADTIMFMTDGRPTAGRVQELPRILDQVRIWQRTTNVRLHCVGVGEHDETFLRDLAAIGDGQYAKR
jgi:Mg-chelatase subunit ChlD